MTIMKPLWKQGIILLKDRAMRRSLFISFALAAILSLASPLPLAWAGISFSGNVEPDPTSWTSDTNGYVGNTSDGTLTVDSGSNLLSSGGTIAYSSGVIGFTTVDGSGSQWTNVGDLCVGCNGNGTLTVTNSGAVNNVVGCIGYNQDSSSVVTVDGSGSTWTNSDRLRIGYSGNGVLNITNGGRVDSAIVNTIGLEPESAGTVTVSGNGSMLTSGYLNVGYTGRGVLRVVNGGTVSSYISHIGYDCDDYDGPIRAIAAVEGSGSLWNNYELHIGENGQAKLAIMGGGTVTAKVRFDLGIWSWLLIDVGRGSSLVVGDGTSPIFNQRSFVNVLAGAGVEEHATFTPISSGSWIGGLYRGIGGTLNGESHQFTASAVVNGTASMPVAMDLAEIQRVLVCDAAGARLGASFPSTPDSLTINFTGSTIADGILDELILPASDTVLSGWDISASSEYPLGWPTYLSFDVGHAQLLDDLKVWHYDESGWSEYEAFELTYDRTYVSLLVGFFGDFAVTGKLVLDGDADRDGTVNGTDLNTVLSNYNQPGPSWVVGDFNADGTVNGTDLNIVLSNYGRSLPASTAAVPEPGAFVLLAIGLLSLLAYAGWKRSSLECGDSSPLSALRIVEADVGTLKAPQRLSPERRR